MQTIHADRHLAIDVHVSHEHFVRAQREDFEEMLGNLVDNASKWAKTRIDVRSAGEGATRAPDVVQIDLPQPRRSNASVATPNA